MFNAYIMPNRIKQINTSLKVDIHSHLLPEYDDGVSSFDQAIELILELEKLGFEKLILTPHIMKSYYEYPIEALQKQFSELRLWLKKADSPMQLALGAEYYLDDYFFGLLEKKAPLLLLDDSQKLILVECAIISQPEFIIDATKRIKQAGYTPILAHPERYSFFKNDIESLKLLRKYGLHFQININSLVGFHSKPSQQIAESLISNRLVSYLGTDCHNYTQIIQLTKAMQTNAYEMAVRLGVLNNELYHSADNANFATIMRASA